MRALQRFVAGAEAEAGQAIILIAITLLGMIMMVGVAIDAGQLYSARRSMQEAADAAAYAASVTLYQGGTQAQAFAAAVADAAANGYTNGVNRTTVTVREPLTAPYNTAAFVEVLIDQNVQTALVPAQSALTSVSVRAISGAESFNNRWAIIALAPTATANALLVNSGASVTLNGGGVLVNSTAANAASSSTSNWSITCPVSSPCEIDVAGGTSGTWPAANPPTNFLGTFTGKPQGADPFAGYPKPSLTGLLKDRAGFGPGNNTVGQGYYTTSIGQTKNLCHGTYVLVGAGMGSVGVDTTSTDPVTGDRCDGKVFIFNTTSTYPLSGGSCQPITWNGANTVQLSALATGPYKGMLVYQDAACAATMIVGGGGGVEISSGTFYLPNAAFQGSGGSQVDGGQIVAKTINLSITVNITFNANTSAQPILPRLAK